MASQAHILGSGQAGTTRVRWLAGLIAFLVVLLLVALVVLVQRSIHQRDAALARTQRSYAVVLLTSEVDGSLGRAEAALARFSIDLDRRSGTIYYDEWRNAGHLIDALGVLVRDDPAQAVRMVELRRLYQERGAELARPATRATYHQGWQALSLFASAGKSTALPKISAVLNAMAHSETALLDRRSDFAATRVDRSNQLAAWLSAVGGMLALSVIALGWLTVRMMADRRAAREIADHETIRADALERAVAERTAELSEANRRLVREGRTRAEAEAKLRQVQKMDAVGQLTGGIAHDFNNMLAVVLGGLEMARKRVTEQAEEANRHIASAMEGAERAAALTRRLLSFARAEPLLPQAVDPGALLHEMDDLVDRTIGERIVVRILADPGVWPVWVDAYQLENAILNLAVNARDAMGGVGTLAMTAANARLRAGQVGALAAGDYVRIAVTDNGAGMSAATLERVFEPFFTTKPVGQGTGLGLSQILSFARQSGGDVAIASVEGEGTTVSLYLPRHRGQVVEQPVEASAAPRIAVPAGGRVLVVEDDARVRAATTAALDELGYEVIACETGAQAIARIDRGEAYRLLVTDVLMPGMTGPELVHAVRARRPDLPVLFVTGYVGEASEAGQFRDAGVLRKPFTLRALGDAVGEALREPAMRAA